MKPFGNQIEYFFDVLDAKKNPVDMGGIRSIEDGKSRLELHKEYSRVIMQIVVSLIVILSCFYLLFFNESENLQKLASGLIGTVIGYWLR
jgi:hypothetical protein